ncbi:endonuclease/exonuclease/phosphatase family protein [Alienimonas sp. DA493]|uniref:endonuclease/exonuclease/phosphatase family protein n=1 Tax=Alienimonas sp. DA493 TaxID=3373605 RepID=UPI00375515D8
MNARTALPLVLAVIAVGCSPAPEPESTPAPAPAETRPEDPLPADPMPTPTEANPTPANMTPATDAPPAFAADDVTVVTWNSGPIFSVADAEARAADFAALAADVGPDVVLLQEITSREVAESVAASMGLPTGPEHVVVSDFNPNDDAEYSSLEVAILSRYPLTNAVEFDRGTDGNSRPGYPPERKLERVDLEGIADVGVGRGFLAANAPGLGAAFVVTHLKSSGGRSGDADRDNARKREIVAAAMAEYVVEEMKADPDLTVVVGGDFNVGETDAAKNGRDLADDRTDGYDDTHALMAGGLVDGLRLRSLTRETGNTYDDTPGDGRFPYPGVGAIDVLYVGGAAEDRFETASRGGDTFGSDHYPVRATMRP